METLAIVGAVTSAAQAGLGIVQGRSAAKAAERDAERQRQYYEDKAKADLAQGTLEARNEAEKVRLILGANTAAAAASGTAADYGDAVRLGGQVAERGAYNVQAILYDTDQRIASAQNGADEAVASGRRGYRSATMSAIGSGLGFASSLGEFDFWGDGGGDGQNATSFHTGPTARRGHRAGLQYG